MGVPDNGPLIVGVTWWLTFLCGGFLALRIYAKLSRRQGLWWDDHILIASWFLLLIEAILTQMGQLLGFGRRIKDIDPDNIMTIILWTSIGASISCFASTLSKISFGATLLRLTSGPLRWFVWFCTATLFLFMLPSAFIIWVQCTPVEKTWDSTVEGKCWDPTITVNYGIFNAAWCATADIALALVPWKLVWGLQLRLREKIGVGIAMSMGILAGVCAIAKGVYLIQLRQGDFSYNGKDVTIWTAVETAVAIIGASIPVLRVFFREKVASYSNSRGRSMAPSTHQHIPSTPATTRRSIALSSMAPNRDKDGVWTRIEPIDEWSEHVRSVASVRSAGERSDEEIGIAITDGGRGGSQEGNQEGLWQKTTTTRTMADGEREAGRDGRGTSWLI
ncbi:uncharacterized protein EKO05_0002740 [Ascochyta rabiei]|uniref:Uncharacterized protein n=1 Tax=Didymella rabiei TaxID=5454 RepID=A0A163M0G7_DIDRA|nr:uncharacterized protein EKO05_0002740 [Ascochyta rabiei]KZM28288.1 hypothetical protein ST47_g569 [Ascochyta rabiei]UPX12174.1 hypothetical protein EKO05_0002740 [Ascochyta rabiei]